MPALGVLGLLFLFLAMGGANDAARAALLSAALCAALTCAIMAAPQHALMEALAFNWLSVAAAVTFVLLSLATLAPAGWLGLSAHPIWLNAPDAPLSMSPYRTLEGMAAFLAPCAAFLLGAILHGERHARDWSGRWSVLLAGGYAILGLHLFFDGRSGPRLDVGVGSANVAAAAFGVFALICAAMVARAARGRFGASSPAPRSAFAQALLGAPLSIAVFIVLIAAGLLTASRAGLIVSLTALACFGVLIWALSSSRSGVRTGAALAPVLLLSGLILIAFARGGADVMERFALSGEDWQTRQVMAETHWRLFLERPLLGHGLNSFHELNASVLTADVYRQLSSAGSTHNIFIQALEETGLLGLSLLACMVAPLLFRALLRVAARAPGGEWAAAAFSASMLLLIHGWVDFALQTPALSALYAFFMGAWLGRPAR